MVTDWIINVFYGFVQWAISLLPTGPAPDFFTTTSGALASMISGAQGFSAWVPWPFVLGVVGGVLVLWLTLTAIKGIRWVVGWIPTMGGS